MSLRPFAAPLTPAFMADSSRVVGRALRSAYLRQLRPQVSHRIPVERPFGAFHQTLDSRVRQAAQKLECRAPAEAAGTFTMELLSSSSCFFPFDNTSCWVLLLLSALRFCSFSSFNRALRTVHCQERIWLQIENEAYFFQMP